MTPFEHPLTNTLSVRDVTVALVSLCLVGCNANSEGELQTTPVAELASIQTAFMQAAVDNTNPASQTIALDTVVNVSDERALTLTHLTPLSNDPTCALTTLSEQMLSFDTDYPTSVSCLYQYRVAGGEL